MSRRGRRRAREGTQAPERIVTAAPLPTIPDAPTPGRATQLARVTRQASAISGAIRQVHPLTRCRIVFPVTGLLTTAVVETVDHRVALASVKPDGELTQGPGGPRFDHSIRVMLDRDFPPFGDPIRPDAPTY